LSSQTENIEKTRSAAWYLLPIFLSIIGGGVIAYLVIRKDDPKKAKICLITGIAITAVSIVASIAIGMAGFADIY